ncbi:PRTRC system protein C [Mucilaginibacter sp. UYCu711]|uniref:PRTRC system protein C n=1 Tax=Mucilaginibacter sp. UYCu711 TaxID=3156339 RepID=UPI003D2639BE
MAVLVENTRSFIYVAHGETEPIDLADPNPDFSVEEVLNFYTTAYPTLTTATIMPPKISADGGISYTFSSTVGTKG